MTRRELLAMIGVATAAGCRGAAPPTETPQQRERATATLTVSGMI
jgi:hypothetical protein